MAEEGRPREGASSAAPAQDDLFSRWVAARTTAPAPHPAEPAAVPAEPAAVPAEPAAVPSEPAVATAVPDVPADVAAAVPSVGPDTRDAGRAVLAAFLDDRHVPPPPHEPAARRPEPEALPDEPEAPPAEAEAPCEHARTSTDATFPVRRGAQRVVGVVLLASLAATAWTAYGALAPRPSDDTPTLGLAITCAALTLVLWAVRASMPATEVAISRGLLEVSRGDKHWSIDLTSPHTPAELVGRPTGRRWRVRFPRLDQDPLVLDASMVDPDDFTAAVLRFRPDLELVLCPWQSRGPERAPSGVPSHERGRSRDRGRATGSAPST